MTDKPDQSPPDSLDDYARLISGLVHDLRTPLTSIIGAGSSLSMYAERFDAETRKKLLESIVDEAEHLDRMLSNLSVIAKMRGGALAPSRRTIPLRDLLASAAEKAGRRDEATRLRVADSVPDMALEADAGLIQNAVLNLLEITARFARDGATTELAATPRGDVVAIAWTVPVTTAGTTKIANLISAFGEGRRDNKARASDLILLEAAQQVVQSHGGRLTITCGETDTIDVLVELPIDPR